MEGAMHIEHITTQLASLAEGRVRKDTGGARQGGGEPVDLVERAFERKTDDSLRKDKEILDAAGKKLEEALAERGLKLKYHVDEASDTVQVEIVDPESGKVVRKLPPDDILKLARSVREMARGFLDKMS
jgi:flagellar protein FlaG